MPRVDAQLRGKCIERLAFSDPVWAVPQPRLGGVIGPIGGVLTR